MSLGYGTTWSSSYPGTQLTMTTSSPSLGERCADTAIPAGLVQLGDDMPSVATTITSWRVTVCPVLALLSRPPTQSLSLRTYVG
jgi:hypothetical protein